MDDQFLTHTAADHVDDMLQSMLAESVLNQSDSIETSTRIDPTEIRTISVPIISEPIQLNLAEQVEYIKRASNSLDDEGRRGIMKILKINNLMEETVAAAKDGSYINLDKLSPHIIKCIYIYVSNKLSGV